MIAQRLEQFTVDAILNGMCMEAKHSDGKIRMQREIRLSTICAWIDKHVKLLKSMVFSVSMSSSGGVCMCVRAVTNIPKKIEKTVTVYGIDASKPREIRENVKEKQHYFEEDVSI